MYVHIKSNSTKRHWLIKTTNDNSVAKTIIAIQLLVGFTDPNYRKELHYKKSIKEILVVIDLFQWEI